MRQSAGSLLGDSRPPFAGTGECWVCGQTGLVAFHEFRLDYRIYRDQDPELADYSGQSVRLMRCDNCGFAQPEKLPTLAHFFDRMYDQRWSSDWLEREFRATYKDLIFENLLGELERLVTMGTRSLLDVGAHVGRFMTLARDAGWNAEGLELNPTTAAIAAKRTGLPVHHVNARKFATTGRQFRVVTLIDVLEHIPEPIYLLRTVKRLLEPGGVVAVKVPCGPAQRWKEQLLAAIRPGRKISLADNLVHVNHFSPRSLRLAFERAGYLPVSVRTAPPELPDEGTKSRRLASRTLRLGAYHVARLPGFVRTPLALNLLAYARVDTTFH